mgnify:CR=1 FL=1
MTPLQKNKKDKIDTQIIAQILFRDNSNSYLPIDYHINELKSLARHNID